MALMIGACTEPFNPDCVTEAASGHRVYKDCGGMTFDIEVPPQCLTDRCGLIVDMHGGTMTATQQDSNTTLRELGRQYGFVVLQPSAPFSNVSASHDVYIRSMIERLIGVYQLDRKRIHITGFSQGGYLTWRFICHSGDMIASAAPMAAATGGNRFEPPGCSFRDRELPRVEIPVLYLHGTKDEWVIYEAALAQRDAVLAAWNMGEGHLIADEDTYHRTRYENQQGNVFEFISHDYSSDAKFMMNAVGGHCFPGSVAFDAVEPWQMGAFGCEPPNAFHWGFEVIKFFLANPKP